MKKTYAALAASVVASNLLYATNGDTLIAVGAKTRAMGGAGIALSQGAESTLVNPASITKVHGNEISFGGTIFMPSIKTTMNGKEAKSASDLNIIPAVAIASEITPNIYAGIGMYGTAGMGVDFRGNPELMDMETTLQLIQFAMPVAYKFANGLSIGIAPILQYGSLDINYNHPQAGKIGYGQKANYGAGVSAGVMYDFGNGFSVGAVYKSEIEMDYPKVLTTAAQNMVPGIGDKLTQPAEAGIGVAYTFGPHTIAADYKKIFWSKAEGYKNFKWKNQNIFAVGYQYDADKWSLRAGYNHSSSALDILPMISQSNGYINTFNLLGFPATSKNHFTIGGSYQFSKGFSADLTLVYSPKSTTSANTGSPYAIINKHSELGLSAQINYKF